MPGVLREADRADGSSHDTRQPVSNSTTLGCHGPHSVQQDPQAQSPTLIGKLTKTNRVAAGFVNRKALSGRAEPVSEDPFYLSFPQMCVATFVWIDAGPTLQTSFPRR